MEKFKEIPIFAEYVLGMMSIDLLSVSLRLMLEFIVSNEIEKQQSVLRHC